MSITDINISKSYAFLEDFSQACQYMQKAIEADKHNYAALNNMGVICYHSGEHEEALEYYRKALAIVKNQKNDEEVVRTLMNIGRSYIKSDQQKALSTYREALVLAEKHEFVQLKATLLMLEVHFSGRSLVWSGSREVAEFKADQIRSCMPD